jgi:hypothetical protein
MATMTPSVACTRPPHTWLHEYRTAGGSWIVSRLADGRRRPGHQCCSNSSRVALMPSFNSVQNGLNSSASPPAGGGVKVGVGV